MGLENLRTAVKRALAAGAAALLATAAGAPAGADVASREVVLEEAGLPVVVRLPEGYDPGRPWPLVVFLHGAGECGSDGRQAQVGLGPAVAARPDRWPCLVLMPQKPSREHQWEAYEDQVLAAITEARARWNIDGDRIALTGLSQGGHGTWVIGARNPGLFSCLVPVCGYGSVEEVAPRVTRLPVWAFHGLRDDVVDPRETLAIMQEVRRLRGSMGGDPDDARLTLYPVAGHNSWDAAYAEPDLAAWLLSRVRADAGP
jgi:predicted peptidase